MRIIAGSARGRRLTTADGNETRPTLDRVKESIFGILQFEIAGQPVLDLFAGSGSLGLEALSRGASFCVFVDRRLNCVNIIRENVDKLGFGARANVRQADYVAAIAEMRGEGNKFKFVFLDPPYHSGFGVEAARRLIGTDMLLDGAMLVIEDKEAVKNRPGEYMVVDVRKYGDTFVSFLKPDKPVAAEDA